MAEQRRPPEFHHERSDELVERIRQDHHLPVAAQGIEKLDRPRQRLDPVNDRLQRVHADSVAVQDIEARAHQNVVIGLVAGGPPQRVDAGALGKLDPDFRRNDAFHVETDDFHVAPPGC